jgi:mono/diheme cytochrome c family protein
MKNSLLTCLLGLMGFATSAFATSAFAQDAALIERGRDIASGVAACGNCHAPMDATGKPLADRLFAGGNRFPEAVFTAYSSNITPDPETGIGQWTDGQIVRAIREGIRPNGSVIGPPMPIEAYRDLADADLEAIVAYLRSIPPIKNQVSASQYTKFKLPPNHGPPVKNVTAPPKSSLVMYGRYLTNTVGHCSECHSAFKEGRPDQVNGLGAGGRPFPGPWGASVARNLTPHATGLKDWTDPQVERAIRTGVRRDGSSLKPPMGNAFYKDISAGDMTAIIACLRSLKPLPTGG